MAGGRPLLNYASLDNFSTNLQQPLGPQVSAVSATSNSDAPNSSEAASWHMTGVCQVDKSSGLPSRMFGMTGGPHIDSNNSLRFKSMQASNELQTAVKLDTGNMIFNCQNCSKTFVERTSYQAHTSTHVQCEFDGCDYEAIRSVMSKHYMVEHVKKPAAAAVAAAASSKSGISSYIQDRKAKFPTKSLIAAKAENEKDKVSRGEVLVAQNKRGNYKLTGSEAFIASEREAQSKRAMNITGTIPPKNKNYIISGEDLDVDIEWNEDEDISTQPAALQELLNDAKTAKPQPNHRTKKVKDPQIQGTFLEKLLQPEIRHERNVLLQCIRYIVDNSYFMRPIDLLPHEMKLKPEPLDEDEELEQGEIDDTQEREEEVRAASHTFSIANFLHNTINPEGIKHDPAVASGLRPSTSTTPSSELGGTSRASSGNRSPHAYAQGGLVVPGADSEGEEDDDDACVGIGVEGLVGKGTLGEGMEKWTHEKRRRVSGDGGVNQQQQSECRPGRGSNGGVGGHGASECGPEFTTHQYGSGGDDMPEFVCSKSKASDVGNGAGVAPALAPSRVLEPMDEAEALLLQIEKEYNL